MQKYLCEPCGYIYDPAEGDPDSGIAPGTAFKTFQKIGAAPSAVLRRKISYPTKTKHSLHRR